MQTDSTIEKNKDTFNSKPKNKRPVSNSKKRYKYRIIKPLFFVLIILFIILSICHSALLTSIGSYLILEHKPEKADLIVCLGGGNIERGLATADAYNAGLASMVYISRPEVPDGYDLLEKMDVKYPEQADLMEMFLKDLNIPGEAIIRDDAYVNSTLNEAVYVRREVERRGFKSLIIITSPTHSRRAWLTYKKVFEGSDVTIYSLPTKYSKYNPETYWHDRKYLKDVLLEYQKFLFYMLRYGV